MSRYNGLDMNKEDQIIISSIEDSDLDEIVDLGLNTPELHVQEEGKTAYYYPKDILASFIKSTNDIHLVAKINGKIAGYRLGTYNPYLKEAYLIDMVVKPEYRNRGVANALYKETFRLLDEKGCEWAWALVKPTNKPMAQILTKKGFKKGTEFNFFHKTGPFSD